MMTVTRRAALTGVALSGILFQFSCSNAPAPPQKGTPAFYWSAARETYEAGDYLKTIEHLEKIVATDNDYTARALPWLLIMTSGMSKGYMDLGDAFEAGARMNKSDPTAFRRNVSQFRGEANRLALRFAEAFAAFQKTKSDQVALTFPFPTRNPGQVVAMTKVYNGIMPSAEEVDSAHKRTLERQVSLAACRAVGAPENPTKAQEIFKAANAQTPRATFVTSMAEAMQETTKLYGRQKLDQPDKAKIFSARAMEALKDLPDSKEVKELRGKIDASLKKK